MPLVIHQPQAEMGGGQVIRVSNHDRTTRWVTFHFDSEAERLPLTSFSRMPF